MLKLAKPLAVLALAGLATTAAAVSPDKGAILGKDAAAISAALAMDGYEVTRYNRAPALIQVVAVKDSQKHLIMISPRDGTVISHKTGTVSAPQAAAAGPADLAGKLAAQGYELRRVKNEGYELEAYATRDGQLWELKLDPQTGDILRAEIED